MNNHDKKLLAFPIGEVKEHLGISRSTAYNEIKAGRLKAVKAGDRTLIAVGDALDWLAKLPPFVVGQSHSDEEAE